MILIITRWYEFDQLFMKYAFVFGQDLHYFCKTACARCRFVNHICKKMARGATFLPLFSFCYDIVVPKQSFCASSLTV